jgi:hypothetical protein
MVHHLPPNILRHKDHLTRKDHQLQGVVVIVVEEIVAVIVLPVQNVLTYIARIPNVILT